MEPIGSGLPQRVGAYIDGFNFYRGMMAKGWGRYRWLDWVTLMGRFVQPGDALVSVKYFTSLVTHEPRKLPRQNQYLKALAVHGGLEVIVGEFEQRDAKCAKCGEYYKRPQEKRTDVNIATHMVADAHENAFDTEILLTADSDLLAAVDHVRARVAKRIVLLDPPKRHSNDLAARVDAHLHIPRHMLHQSQLPNPVEYETRRGKPRRLYRPDEWGPEQL